MDPTQTVFTIPFGTYFVAYPGTVASGEILQIPNFHQRENDAAQNPQIRVVIQNLVGHYTDPYWFYQENVLEVLDVGNVSCAYILPGTAWQIETDALLKIRGSAFAVYATQAFRILVFYKKP